MDKVKVGILGYGTIGKRVADAVRLQDDMELIGVTANSYNYRMVACNQKGIPIYSMGDEVKKDLSDNDISSVGNFKDLLDKVDIIVDCAPKKVGAENKENFYIPHKIKAIFQGGEKDKTVDTSFVAQCNYDNAKGKDFVRVVSCNTTGLCRTLNAINQKFGIVRADATMIRRGADPWDIRHGPINAIVPVLELPSHHGPDVKTVLPDMNIFTTALSVPTTLMHMHNLIVDLRDDTNVEEVLDVWKNTTRVKIVSNKAKIRSTAEIIEFARDSDRQRGDMPEICIWEEGVGVQDKKLFYMQAIHQEADVVVENIDAIRAMFDLMPAEESIAKTNKTLGIK